MAALARSVLRYSARHEAAASDSFADHVIAGLGDNPKWLSAKYFYDAAGSRPVRARSRGCPNIIRPAPS